MRIWRIVRVWFLLMSGIVQGISAQEYTLVTIDRVENTGHFERLQAGIQRFKEDTGHQVHVIGPSEADAELQVQLIEDAIVQHVDAICIIPISSVAAETVLQKAIEQGIIVISHGMPDLQQIHYDLEAFENISYGIYLMKRLAHYMEEKGEYAIFVETSSANIPNEWVHAAIAFQKERYPNMHLVTRPLENYADPEIAYQKTYELLKAYPQIRGIYANTASAIQGVARAIEELKLQIQVMLVGTGLIDKPNQYLVEDSLKLLSFWEPADLAYAMNALAVMLLDGETITEGTDLGVPGYNHLLHRGNVLYGNAWIDLIQTNILQEGDL